MTASPGPLPLWLGGRSGGMRQRPPSPAARGGSDEVGCHCSVLGVDLQLDNHGRATQTRACNGSAVQGNSDDSSGSSPSCPSRSSALRERTCSTLWRCWDCILGLPKKRGLPLDMVWSSSARCPVRLTLYFFIRWSSLCIALLVTMCEKRIKDVSVAVSK
ncbi:uncharacterized protein LOC125532731 [Triticum urartu]|uniref:uncharacterized protein LOC125532731 n=1 Tax=Triticum urartu TaxID=4572 RepID=UPI002042BE14|nr:uncharacterized protein LOC125532731 [Triticum urartu]